MPPTIGRSGADDTVSAIARRYTLNQYGITTSPLQGGLPTDRLVAEWWLRSRRVETLLSTGKNAPAEMPVKISVPAQIYAWKAAPESRSRAAEVQARNRQQFLKSFRQGLSVIGYERDPEGNGTFLLGRWNESWSYASDATHEN